MRNRPYVIGLTGGIASGKTAAGVILENLGAYIVDADVISREVVEPGKPGYKKLRKAFPGFFGTDGVLDRRALRRHVFESNRRQELDDIMLELIISETERQISECGRETAVLIAPLLIEAGLKSMVDTLIVLIADPGLRIERLVKRDNIEAELAQTMLLNQTDDKTRLEYADIVIYNDGNLEDLAHKITECYESIKKNNITDS